MTSSDVVGKSGIEKSMEAELQGKKGSETIYVDNLGKQLDVTDVKSNLPPATTSTWRSTKTCRRRRTDVLEKKACRHPAAPRSRMSRPTRLPEDGSNSSLITPIYDVYNACLNNIIDLEHLMSGASATVLRKRRYTASSLDYSDGVTSTGSASELP
jgi:penicillin-binding protein 2